MGAGLTGAGGEEYIEHLLSSNVLTQLAASLDLKTSPSKLILSSLRTLNTMSDTYFSPSRNINPRDAIATILYIPEVLENVRQILAQERNDVIVQQQISLAASLIAKTVAIMVEGDEACEKAERHQRRLVEAGVLDALATRLGSFYVKDRRKHLGDSVVVEGLPAPAPPSGKVAPILQAIAAIIQGQKLWGLQFVYALTMMRLFPVKDGKEDEREKVASGASSAAATFIPQGKTGSAQLQPPSQIITPAAFPPLSAAVRERERPNHPPPSYNYPSLGSAVGASTRRRPSWTRIPDEIPTPLPPPPPEVQEEVVAEEEEEEKEKDFMESRDYEETDLAVTLIGQVRTGDAMTRLAAASVLTNLFVIGLVPKKLHSILALLVVPVLVRLLDEDDRDGSSKGKLEFGSAGVGGVDLATWNKWQVEEMAPAVLARLIVDSAELQKAAFEADAIKKLAGILKKACEVPQPEKGPPEDDCEGAVQDEEFTRGPHYYHRMRVKDSSLRALANLGLSRDEYRKSIIEAGIPTLIVANCLRPDVDLSIITPEQFAKSDSRGEPNPPEVLVAACSVIRSVSRSVSILRTSLIDAGIAIPTIALLRHPAVSVRLEAAKASCNLVLEFSPMRKSILEVGGVEVLCRLAKEGGYALRMEALWALRHLVLKADREVVEKCLNLLGGEFIISHLNPSPPTTTAREDGEMGGEGGDMMDLDLTDAPTSPTLSTTSTTSSSTPTPSTHNSAIPRHLPARATKLYASTLHALQTASLTAPQKQSTLLQSQTLHFLRNALHDPNVIDPILTPLIPLPTLLSSLLSILTPAIASEASSSWSSQPFTPDPDVLEGLVYLLIHIINAGPQHRSLVMESKELMEALKGEQVIGCRKAEVRCGVVWMLITASLGEEGDDVSERRERCERLGREWGAVLERLAADRERDVVERVRMAKVQIDEGIKSR